MPSIIIGTNKIYYERMGQGAPLIFLHGNPGTHRLWQHQLSYFKERYSLFAVDMRGFGQSEKPVGADYHPFALARDIAKLSSTLSLERPILVGLSMGSMVALSLALEYPLTIGGLVLAGATSDRRDRDPAKELEQLERLGFDLYLTNLVNSWYSPEADPHFIEQTLAEARTTERHVREATIHALSEFHITERLHEITVPTLIMAGEKDLITPLHHARVLHERVPKSRFVVFPNGRHMFIVEYADQVNAVMDSFLQEIRH